MDVEQVGSIVVPTRQGVALTGIAGLESRWAMPVAIWHAPRGFDTTMSPDNHPHNTIAMRLSGSLVRRVNPARSPVERLSSSGFSVHPALYDLRFVAPSEIRFAHLYLSEEYLRFLSVECGCPATSKPMLRDDRVMYDDDEMRHLVKAYLGRACNKADEPSRLEMDSRANLIGLRLLSLHLDKSKSRGNVIRTGILADWQVKRVRDYIAENLHRDISLADLATLIDLSAEHLCRAFRRTVGVPPHQWLLRCRIEKARTLLTRKDLSLTEVALEIGFSGQSSFGAAFRRATGTTPSAYRRDL